MDPRSLLAISSLLLLFAAVPARLQSQSLGPDLDQTSARSSWQPNEQMPRSPGFSPRLGKFLGSGQTHREFASIPPGDLTKPLSPAWQPIGTSVYGLVSGRCKAIAVDVAGGKIAYLGTSSGGVWRTNDITAAEVQWIDVSDGLPTLGIGAIVIHPNDPNVVYVGTGPNPGSEYNPDGQGMFRSTDGGLNWQQIADVSTVGYRCAAIAIDPSDPQRIFVATGWQVFTDDVGVVRSIDGGQTWECLAVDVENFTAACVVIDPSNSMNVYVGGQHGRIVRSTDGGESWMRSTRGLPSSGGRMQLAIAPSSPNVIYASAARDAEPFSTLGLYKSDDRGASWRRMNDGKGSRSAPNANYLGGQGHSMNSIAIDPSNAARLILGGLDIYFSDDSGKTLERRTNWQTDPMEFESGDFVHGDIQSLSFANGQIIACTDGGLALSSNFGSTWSKDLNRHLSTLQFVGLDADQEMNFFVAGSQDNGSARIESWQTFWEQTRIGDGGQVWISRTNPDLVYTTHIYADCRKSTDGGVTWETGSTGLSNLVTNPDFLDEGTFTFYPPFDVSEDGEVIAMPGLFHMYVSRDGGIDGFEQQSQSEIGLILDVDISPFNARTIYACGLGWTYHTTDQGLNWDTVSINNADAGIHVIHADPYREGVVYTIYNGHGVELHKSTDGGKTFSLLSVLPAVGPNDMVVTRSGVIIIATGEGVIYSDDNGSSWKALRDGIPSVPVLQLRLKGANDDKLLAATFGRGGYWIDVSSLGSDVRYAEETSNATIESGPNPARGGSPITIDLSIKRSGEVKISLFDQLGKECAVIKKDFLEAGSYTLSARMPELPNGKYYLVATSRGSRVSHPLIVID